MRKLILLLLSLLSFNGFCASWATVKVEKAVVFADKDMTSGVGFLKKNKKVRIGDKPRNRGQVYPFIYQKKILYIRAIDIQTSDELLALSSAMERIAKKTKSGNPYQKIGLSSGIGMFNLLSDVSYDGINSKSLSVTELSLVGRHIRPIYEDAFKINFSGTFGSIGVEEFNFIKLELYYQRLLYKVSKFNLYYALGAIVTPLFSYKYGSDFTQNGSGYGIAADVELNYNFTDKFSASLNGNYRYEKLSVDLPEFLVIDSYRPTLSGVKINLGLHYSY